MTKLWQKDYQANSKIEHFEAAQNSALDMRLIRHDVWGSLAHAAMLKQIGILTASEFQAIKTGLNDILALEETGEFTISPSDEDVHTSIENYLASTTGAAGKKIHTARSRNDQVLVDLRLYGKEQLLAVADKLCQLCAALAGICRCSRRCPNARLYTYAASHALISRLVGLQFRRGAAR